MSRLVQNCYSSLAVGEVEDVGSAGRLLLEKAESVTLKMAMKLLLVLMLLDGIKVIVIEVIKSIMLEELGVEVKDWM